MRDPAIYAVPFFLATAAMEAVILARQHRPYWAKDTAASVSAGLGQILLVTFCFKGLGFALLLAAYEHRFFTLPGAGVLALLTAIVAEDFTSYWSHRASHEIRVFWATHIVHHSSQRFTLGTALRQSWTGVQRELFWLPLPLFGFAPRMVFIAHAVNLLYQYWIHTELVGKMPRWFEAVMNTPSHHRVHHGSNPQYIDKNYANIFIIWDKMFGTFEPEGEKVTYGLTHNIDTYNPFRIQFDELITVFKESWQARGWREKCWRMFGRPSRMEEEATTEGEPVGSIVIPNPALSLRRRLCAGEGPGEESLILLSEKDSGG